MISKIIRIFVIFICVMFVGNDGVVLAQSCSTSYLYNGYDSGACNKDDFGYCRCNTSGCGNCFYGTDECVRWCDQHYTSCNANPGYGNPCCSGWTNSIQTSSNCTCAPSCPTGCRTYSVSNGCGGTCPPNCYAPNICYNGVCCTPTNGGWSGWSTCSNCSQSRTCTNPSPSCGGAGCSGDSTQSCGLVNGGWSAWSSCNNCVQTRTCTNPSPACGGANCVGPSSQSCGLVNGGWCDYSPSCNPACGQIQTRTCNCPAPACGGASCSGSSTNTCSSADDGNPAQVTIVSPAGLSSSPTIYSNVTSTTLSWNSVTALTDRYEVVVVVDGIGTTVLNNTNVTPATASSLSSGTLSYNILYRWHARAVNTSCGTDYGSWSDWGYFRFNRPPVFNNTPDTDFLLRNSDSVDVSAVSGRNHLCQTQFMNSSNGREAIFRISISDPDGVAQVDKIYFRMRFGTNDYLMFSADSLSGTPSYSLVGNGASIFGSSTTSTAGTTRTVNFPVLFDDDFSGGTFRIYDMQVYGEDIYGLNTGWSDTNRDFKVWDCNVDAVGGLYDSSMEPAVVCATGTGFSQLADRNATNFLSLDYVPSSGPTQAMTINTDSSYYSGSNDLRWNSNYLAYFNGALDNDGLDMADPKVNVRIIDLSIGETTCDSGSFVFDDSDTSDYIINPYSDNVRAQIDFTSIANQDPWFRGMGVSVLGRTGVTSNVPLTCRQTEGCIPALTIDNIGRNDNGVVMSTDLGLSAGDWGYSDNWYKDDHIQNYLPSLTYDNMHSELFDDKGVGREESDWAGVLSVGGTGLVFVTGPLTITSDHTVAPGGFLMVVVNGSITINQNVTRLDGAYVASDGNITINGENDTVLTINGMLYTSGNIDITRGFVTHASNNINPAVVVDMRPDLIFNAPSYMFDNRTRL